jgi:integrase
MTATAQAERRIRRPAITTTAIAAAAKRAAEQRTIEVLKDPDQAGLELRIGCTGKRVWYLQARDATGRPRRHVLGQHPALGLAAAREACRTMREAVRKGADPTADARNRREAVKDAKAGRNTLRALVDVYARQKGAKLKWWQDYRHRIETIFAIHLDRPLTELTLQGLQQSADKWPSTISAATGVRYLRPILKWGAHPGRGYVGRDLALITPPATVQRRQRVLGAEELGKLLPVLRASTSAYAAAMQFILLTLARRNEVATARWRDVDLQAKQWRLPETKNDREHIVPLSTQAVALLRARLPVAPVPDAFVFVSSDEGDGTNPLGNWDRATKNFMEDSSTSGWHRHDLRRTGSTMLGNMGVEPHIIEAALNHVSIHSQLAATYNAARYRPQVADALQRLADRLDIIAQGGADVHAINLLTRGA